MFAIGIVLLLLLPTTPAMALNLLQHEPAAPRSVAPTLRSAPSGTATQASSRASSVTSTVQLGSAPAAVHPSYAMCLVAPVLGCPDPLAPGPVLPSPHGVGISSWANLTPFPIPSTYPGARYLPSIAYDPVDHEVLAFGGAYRPQGIIAPDTGLNDTWSFSAGTWTERISSASCTPTTCPTARIGGMMAWDAADQEAVLFGGITFTGFPLHLLDDTWTFAGGHWTNVTATAGAPPSPRFEGSMTYDSGDGYVLLFGGMNANGTSLGDTWTFAHGAWKNLTSTLSLSPEARDSAAIADSPSGYVFLFGGEENGAILESSCLATPPWLAWWFHDGNWTQATHGVGCPASPSLSPLLTYTSGLTPPCGRVGAALAWSPKNNHFVLFGGAGHQPTTNGTCLTTSPVSLLNDTWVFVGTLGGAFYPWFQDTSTGPTAREYMGYVSDYSDGYILVFAGLLSFPTTNETWRYYERLSAQFKGPSTIAAGAIGFDLFELKAFGGTGDLDYAFATTLLKTSHPLVGNGCTPFTSGLLYLVPSTGVVDTYCTPDITSYNVFRISVTVHDLGNASAYAYANWTVTVEPPEALHVYSQFKGYFYTGFSMNNIFGAYAVIANQPVSTVTGSFDCDSGNSPVGFGHTNSSNLWWNTSKIAMGNACNGVLVVTATISDWSENASIPVSVITVPNWLEQLAALAQVVQSEKTIGKGAFNLSYQLAQKIPIPFGKLFNFSIPVPFASGNYS
ncbi:MAG: kelch motif-containing protein, partial [Thermoplasmata archaeon]|nr:kelch motif-containing protein [Thermoplasmata archaeon]